MVAIAEFNSQAAASRFRFILDRRDVLGAIFVSPAILYVLLLVGVPFLMAVYYSVSAYTIYDPSWQFVGLANFERSSQNPDLPADAVQHLHLHLRIADPRPHPRQVRRAGAAAPVPRPQVRQGADHTALGGAGRARHGRLAVDVRFALQRHQLDADRARLHHPRAGAELARQAGSGDAVGDRRQCLALLPVRHRHLPRRHHRGPAGRARRGDRRRRRFLAPQLPDHRADDPADRGHRPDFRHRVHLHRPFRSSF